MALKENITRIITLSSSILINISNKNLANTSKDLQNLHSSITRVKSKFESISNDILSINPKSTSEYISYLDKYLSEISSQSESWAKSLNRNQQENLIITSSKISTLVELLEPALYLSKNDLFSLELTHLRWQALNSVTSYQSLSQSEHIKENYKKLIQLIACSISAVSKTSPETFLPKRLLFTSIWSFYFLIFPQKGLHSANLLYSTATLKSITDYLSIIETPPMRKLLKFMIPKIHSSKIISISPVVSHALSPYSLLSSPSTNSINFRLLSPKNPDSNQVVFHIHGGGFISMSSGSHESYTRIWSNNLNTSVVSVDYRLSPQYPYPAALDDVWQVWNWLKIYGNTNISLNPVRCVIVGDSAGGNLALALCYLIIKSGLPPPNGIVLAYPALNLNDKSFSPSLLKALDDMLVPHTMLKLCLKAYLQNGESIENPLLSPICTEDEIIEKMPFVKIMTCSEDPFYDDNFRFVERLRKKKVNAEIKVFNGAPHGGLNFAFNGGVKEAFEMVDQGTVWMRNLLKQ